MYYLQSRYYDPQIGRFINADSFASTGQGFIGYNMFAYCLNNPVIFGDSEGTDACLVIDNDGAHGFGHVNLCVQNDDGAWFYYSFATDRKYPLTIVASLFLGVRGKITSKTLGLSNEYDMTSFDGIQNFLSSTGEISNTARDMDVVIHLKGDFTDTLSYCQDLYYAQEEKDIYQRYNLYSHNCMHFALEALMTSDSLTHAQVSNIHSFYKMNRQFIGYAIPNIAQSLLEPLGAVYVR